MLRFAEGTTVYADKGYDSKENRQHLKEHQFLDGIMRKAHRNRPLTEAQTKRNRYLSKTRYVVEQSFGTLHRKFRYARAAYFGLCKVSAQSHLKAMCLNLLKAANRLSVQCACCRLKGGPDALLWGVRGGLRRYLGKIRRYWGREIAENLCLGSGCRGKGILQRSHPAGLVWNLG